MASQSLYRKWRSQTFNEMVGQEEITRTLRNALQNDNLSHAYLFTGPRGTGKTTTARLLAKTVNCTNPRNGEPCNECEQCREITAGTSFNVIEIDAASNRGIDSIRELREKVMMPPSTGKYKIYILDEAHMLTTEAFNALLKTLEEPPDYAIFVMATTDVHKMLPTVLSRCQRFDFKRFSARQIVGHLEHVAREERIELERSAAELIARTAAGGMRDALSLLDQAIAYAGTTISLAQVQAMLGVADPRAIWRLLTHIAGLDSPALLYLIHELSEAGADLRQINAQIIEYWRALLLARAGADVATIMDLTEDEAREVAQLSPQFTLDELTECARIFAQNDLVHKNQGTPQLGLELATLECLELHRRVQSGQPVKSAPVVSQPAPQVQRAMPRPPVSTSEPPSASVPPVLRPTVKALPEDSQAPSARPAAPVEQSQVHITPAIAATAPTESIQAEVSTAPTIGLTLRQVAGAWESVKARTRQKGSLLATYIGMCDVVGVETESEHAIIIIRAAKPAHFTFIKGENRPKEVEWALGLEFSCPCKLRVLAPDQQYVAVQSQGSVSYSMGTVAPPQPAHRERRETPPRTDGPSMQPRNSAVAEKTEKYHISAAEPLANPQGIRENKKVPLPPEELERKVRADPVVQQALQTFGAKIEKIHPK